MPFAKWQCVLWFNDNRNSVVFIWWLNKKAALTALYADQTGFIFGGHCLCRICKRCLIVCSQEPDMACFLWFKIWTVLCTHTWPDIGQLQPQLAQSQTTWKLKLWTSAWPRKLTRNTQESQLHVFWISNIMIVGDTIQILILNCDLNNWFNLWSTNITFMKNSKAKHL